MHREKKKKEGNQEIALTSALALLIAENNGASGSKNTPGAVVNIKRLPPFHDSGRQRMNCLRLMLKFLCACVCWLLSLPRLLSLRLSTEVAAADRPTDDSSWCLFARRELYVRASFFVFALLRFPFCSQVLVLCSTTSSRAVNATAEHCSNHSYIRTNSCRSASLFADSSNFEKPGFSFS